MPIYLNLSEITRPYPCTHTIQENGTCPLLGKPFTQLLETNRALGIPYVFAVIAGPKASRFAISDGNAWLCRNLIESRDFANPETRKRADKAHFVALSTLHNGTTTSRLVGTIKRGGKVGDFLRRYIFATSNMPIPYCAELLQHHRAELQESELFQFAEMLLRTAAGHNIARGALTAYLQDSKDDEEKFERAKKVFGLANRLKNEMLYTLLATGFLNGALTQKRVSFARQVLKKMLIHFPRNATAHLQLGVAYYIFDEEHFMKPSEKEFLAALQLNPRLAGAHYALATMYFTGKAGIAKNVDHAKKHFNELILEPDIRVDWYLLGSKIYLEKECYDLKMARWLLEEAKYLEPENQEVQDAIRRLPKA
jgi:tetratricopeptide (TPR) repeat protein